eukprot:GHVU01102070.1.p2 GENE.GHVU01102070.1~~GHVU01102070.1.p2  ORF type:complete len:118 (-),score=5.92 GHVU01102070.1:453-806(-)
MAVVMTNRGRHLKPCLAATACCSHLASPIPLPASADDTRLSPDCMGFVLRVVGMASPMRGGVVRSTPTPSCAATACCSHLVHQMPLLVGADEIRIARACMISTQSSTAANSSSCVGC